MAEKSWLRKENISRDHTTDPVLVMENRRNSPLTERQNNTFNTFVNTMADDPGDSDCIKSEYGSGSGSSHCVESIDNEDVFNDTLQTKNKERKMSEISSKVTAQNVRKLVTRPLIDLSGYFRQINLIQPFLAPLGVKTT